jgi:proteasome lid subunit RPN8/RPN11
MSSLDIRAIDDKDLKREPAPPAKHEYRVFLSEQAFDRAVERGTSDLSREIGGVLVGELAKDDAGVYLRIESTIDALHAEEKGAELTFTHSTWEHIHKQMDTAHPNKRVVGWYHTHPGFGVFLSDRDRFIHKSFFDLPFQVAFVYDPKSREHGMFTWHDDEPRRARQYWIGEREQVWDGSRGQQPSPAKSEAKLPVAPPPEEDRPREEPLSIGVLTAAGVCLVLLGGLAAHWLFSSSPTGHSDAEVQVEVARAKAQSTEQTIAMLQTDLLNLLRSTLGDQAARKPIRQAVDELDAAIAALDAGSAAGERLKLARANLVQLADERASADALLGQLEILAKRGQMQRTDLGHDVAEQRTGLGSLYAEIAGDAAKARDLVRARRLLATAAHLDPANYARYEKQLQLLDPGAHLPRVESADSGGQP